MADKTETRTGTCPTHGVVFAERRMPRPSFPFIIYAVRRMIATTRPFRCPECGAAVTTA